MVTLGACYRVWVDDHDLVVVACPARLRTRQAHSQGVLVPAESVVPAVLSSPTASSCDLRVEVADRGRLLELLSLVSDRAAAAGSGIRSPRSRRSRPPRCRQDARPYWRSASGPRRRRRSCCPPGCPPGPAGRPFSLAAAEPPGAFGTRSSIFILSPRASMSPRSWSVMALFPWASAPAISSSARPYSPTWMRW